MRVLNHLQTFLPNLHLLTENFGPSLKISNKQKVVWGAGQQKAFEDTLILISNITNNKDGPLRPEEELKCEM